MKLFFAQSSNSQQLESRLVGVSDVCEWKQRKNWIRKWSERLGFCLPLNLALNDAISYRQLLTKRSWSHSRFISRDVINEALSKAVCSSAALSYHLNQHSRKAKLENKRKTKSSSHKLLFADVSSSCSITILADMMKNFFVPLPSLWNGARVVRRNFKLNLDSKRS